MEIFGYTLGKTKSTVELPTTYNDEVRAMSLSVVFDIPKVIVNKSKNYVEYGVDNLYPEFLKSLYNSSPTHQSIVKTKANMVVGDGYTYDDTNLVEKDKINVIKLIDFIDKDLHDLSLDFQIQGGMAFEVIWSLDFTRVVEINRVDMSKLRCGRFDDGEIREWYYKRDWNNKQESPICIPSLDKGNKQDHRQLFYVGMNKVSNDYYYEPSYLGAIDWITLESQCGVYYRSLIEGGFSPSIAVKFFRKPANQEERDEIVRGMKKSYTGVKGNKLLAIFSDGKDLAPEIQTLDVQNMDKQFTVIADQITQKIITGERATTPELFGIAIPGQLGTGDFDTKVKCFTKFVIQPEQKIFEKAINKLISLNGYDVKFKLNPMTI